MNWWVGWVETDWRLWAGTMQCQHMQGLCVAQPRPGLWALMALHPALPSLPPPPSSPHHPPPGGCGRGGACDGTCGQVGAGVVDRQQRARDGGASPPLPPWVDPGGGRSSGVGWGTCHVHTKGWMRHYSPLIPTTTAPPTAQHAPSHLHFHLHLHCSGTYHTNCVHGCLNRLPAPPAPSAVPAAPGLQLLPHHLSCGHNRWHHWGGAGHRQGAGVLAGERMGDRCKGLGAYRACTCDHTTLHTEYEPLDDMQVRVTWKQMCKQIQAAVQHEFPRVWLAR